MGPEEGGGRLGSTKTTQRGPQVSKALGIPSLGGRGLLRTGSLFPAGGVRWLTGEFWKHSLLSCSSDALSGPPCSELCPCKATSAIWG